MPHAKKSVVPSNPELDAHAAEIIKLGRRSFADVVEIGRRLVLCRKLLKTQRSWLAWIRTEFGWSRTHADNLIALYQARDKLQKFCTLLPVSTMYTLAKQDPEVIQLVASRLEAGEPVTAQGIKTMVTIVDREIRSVSYDTTPPDDDTSRAEVGDKITHHDIIKKPISYDTTPPDDTTPPEDETSPPEDEVSEPPLYDRSPPKNTVFDPQRKIAKHFVLELTRLARLVRHLDVAKVASVLKRYEGADMAVRLMADFLQELDRRGESAPLALVAKSDTQH